MGPGESVKAAIALIAFIVYFLAGYWAVNRTIYANKVVIYSDGMQLFIQKSVYALFLGWLLIPVALIRKHFGR